MAAIETNYGGHRFRSRIEARWAAFFDVLGWEWVYEPFDAEGYIPDFRLRGDRPVVVEVKSTSSLDELAEVAEENLPKLGDLAEDYLIVGSDPLTRLDDAPFSDLRRAIGVLADYGEHTGFVVERGIWHRCLECEAHAFHHESMSYASRPCGHYDGDHYLGEPDVDALGRHWGEAQKRTRWVK